MNEESAPIVLITGPPGGGKSTIGRLVAEAFDRSVHIEADVVRESIVGGFVVPSLEWPDDILEQFALQREIVIHWASRMSDAGYVPVVDDAPIPPHGHFEDQYAPLLSRPDVHPIILRADADVVRARIRARQGRFDEMLVGVVDHALGFLDNLDHDRWHTVDTTDLTVEGAVETVVSHLRAANLTG